MKKLLESAQNKLRESCKGCEDVCSVRYHLGYIQAIKDIDKKLKTEGLDEKERRPLETFLQKPDHGVFLPVGAGFCVGGFNVFGFKICFVKEGLHGLL